LTKRNSDYMNIRPTCKSTTSLHNRLPPLLSWRAQASKPRHRIAAGFMFNHFHVYVCMVGINC